MNPKVKHTRGHKVPAEIVTKLATVLPVSEDELSRAAQVAAGFNVVSSSADVPLMVARYFGDEEVSEEEKQATTARLAQILADQLQRIHRPLADPDDC